MKKYMYNFVTLAKWVDNVADGIFKEYHIKKVEVTKTEPIIEVQAVIVNDWSKEKYLYVFDHVGYRLECKEVKPLGKDDE